MRRLERAKRCWPELALVLIVLAAYRPVLDFGFLHYDDYQFVVDNELVRGGLAPGSLRALISAAPLGNWVPLSQLSHALDVELFGLRPAGHHAVNLLLHAANVLLLARLLRTATGERLRSLGAAALFALHPLQVEVVSWVSQRRTLLMTLFGLLALQAYLGYVRRPSPARYLAVAGFFALALLSKAPLVVAPLLMLLLDYWPLGRAAAPRARSFGALLLEKAPLFALAVAVGVVTLQAQRAAQAFQLNEQLGLWLKGSHAAVAAGWYLLRTLWPAGLGAFYPYPMAGDPPQAVLWAAAALAGCTAAAVALRRRRPGVLVGWLWFLVALAPVLGIVQAGGQAYADRYWYLPAIGCGLCAAWLGAGAVRGRTSRWVAAPCAAALLALGAAAAAQTRHWRSEEALFTRAIDVTGGSSVAHNQRGCVALVTGRFAQAAADFEAAIRFDPQSALAHNNLGLAYRQLGRAPEAEAHFARARQLAAGHPPAAAPGP